MKIYGHITAFLLAALLFAAAESVHAAPMGRDDYIFSEIDHRQGLSHSSVICIYKDDSELMWFGTYDGVNCFDGTRMEIFRTDLSHSSSRTLDNNVIYGIMKADGDNLWISTQLSAARFSRTEKVVVANYRLTPDAVLRSNSHGDTWMIGTDSLCFYNTRHERFEGLEKLGLHCTDPASHAFVTGDGELWLFPDSDSGDLYKIAIDGFDSDGGPAIPSVTKQRFHPKPVESIFHDDDTSFCFIDSDKNLYIYDVWRQTKVFIRNIEPLLARYGPIAGVAPFYEDFVIAFRTNGLVRLNATSAYEEEVIDRNLRIFCLRKDAGQGVLWIGVDGRGAMMYAKRHTIATNLMMQRLSPNFTRQVRSIMTDRRGDLWVGTKGDGLIHIRDYAGGVNPDKCTVYYAESRQPARTYVRENTEFQVFALRQSRHMDGFWIGSGPSGIYYRMTDDTQLHRLNLPPGPPVEEVHAFHESGDTVLYVAAARGGLHRLTLDRSGGTPRVSDRTQFRFFHRQHEISTFFSMISDGDSVLWLGSREQGLVRFETATANYDVYSLRELLGRPVDDVLCLARTSDGALLAGTTAGMVSLRFDGRKVVGARYVGREDGLLNDMIHGISEDADGSLWLSTNKGLIKYNPSTVSSHTYYYSGGVQVGEFCDDAYYKCPYTGRLFFGGVDGLLYVDRDGSGDREYYPDILLRGVEFGREPADLAALLTDGTLRFRHTHEELALKFAVPDYISGSRIEYSWMLEGHDKEWTRFGSSSEVFYRGLPAGRYTFRIRYRKDIFDTDFRNLTIPIHILPPWYRTVAARTAFAAILAAAVFAAAASFQRANRRRRLMGRLRQCEHADSEGLQSAAAVRDRESVAGLTAVYRICEALRNENLPADRQSRAMDRVREIITSLLWPYGLADRGDDQKFPPPPPGLQFTVAGPTAIKDTADEALALLLGRGVDVSNVETAIPADLTFPIFRNAFRMLFVYVGLVAAGRRFFISAAVEDSKLTLVFRSTRSSVVRNLRDGLTDGRAPLPPAAGRHTDTAFEIGVLRNFIVQAMQQSAPAIVCDDERSELRMTFAPVSGEEPDDDRRTVLMLEDRDEMYWFVSEMLDSGYVVRQVRSIRQAMEFMEHTRPAAFLVDMNMYGSAGDAFMELLGHNRTLPAHTAFVPLLTWKVPYSVRRDMVLHADAYAVLPYDIVYLREILHKAVYGRIAAESRSAGIEGLSADMADMFTCTTGEQLDFIRRMVAVVEQNIDRENFSTSFIADSLAMSPRQFYRRFKEVSNCPPAMFIKNYRLEKAAALLVETDMPIKEVMDRIGITSRSYLYREFAAKYGTTPSDYRNARGRAFDEAVNDGEQW